MSIVLDESWRTLSPTCNHVCTFVAGSGSRTCNAFPDGIPKEIWNGLNDHRQPYPGDHGVQFRELTDEERPALHTRRVAEIEERRRFYINRKRQEQGPSPLAADAGEVTRKDGE